MLGEVAGGVYTLPTFGLPTLVRTAVRVSAMQASAATVML
jgi:hypothetical protein